MKFSLHAKRACNVHVAENWNMRLCMRAAGKMVATHSLWDRHLRILEFCETSRNLGSFRQLLFLFYQRGDPLKRFKKTCKDYALFLDFSSKGPPFWNNENKSFLNEFKFLEVSLNPRPSKCWNFHLSIDLRGTQNSAKMPQTRDKVICR